MIGIIVTILLAALASVVLLTVVMGVVIWFASYVVDPDGRPPNSERVGRPTGEELRAWMDSKEYDE